MSTEANTEPAAISTRLDGIPLPTRSHWVILVLLAALGIFDAFDLTAFGYTAPAIRADLGLSIAAVGVIGSAAFVGSFVGAIVGGWLADRFGRRPVLLVSVVVYSIGSVMMVLSTTVELLVAARIVTGLGAQAVIVVTMIYIVEMFPARLRGRFVALYLGIVSLGSFLAAVSSWIIVPTGQGHWRWVYGIGSLGLLVVIGAWRRLPESVRWQVRRGHTVAAAATLAEFEKEAVAKTGLPLPEQAEQAERPGTERRSRPSARELLGGTNLKRVLVLVGSMILLAYVFYGFNTWLTTLLVERGYTQQQALTAAAVMSLSNSLGSFLVAPLADRVERKNLVFVVMVIVASLMLVFGLVDNLAVTIVAGFLLAGLLQITFAAMYTYSPEIFPIHLRGLGSGIGGGSSRLSAAFGSIIVGLVLSGFGFTAVFVFFAVVAAGFGVAFLVLGERTKGRQLEDIAAEAGRPS